MDWNSDWKSHPSFLQILQDIGGLPRALQYVLEECLGNVQEKAEHFFTNMNSAPFHVYFHNVAQKLDSIYNIESFVTNNKKIAEKILHHCITDLEISLDDNLGGPFTLEELEQNKHIILRKSNGLYIIEMPFFFIYIYNSYLRLVKGDLEGPFHITSKFDWHQWEVFNAHYEVFWNNLLLRYKNPQPDNNPECEMNIDQKNPVIVTLGELYRGAHGSETCMFF